MTLKDLMNICSDTQDIKLMMTAEDVWRCNRIGGRVRHLRTLLYTLPRCGRSEG